MSTIDRPAACTLYHEVADRVMGLIESGTYAPGTRIPSIRHLSAQLAVSINTVKEAYWLLETRRLIEGRPQSGYFVRRRLPGKPREDSCTAQEIVPREVHSPHCPAEPPESEHTPYRGYRLAKGSPHPSLFPHGRLSACLAAVARESSQRSVAYAELDGEPELRRHIARLSTDAGVYLSPEDFTVTNGCLEAIALAVQVVCRPGDTVAVESPTYIDFLPLLESQGLKAVEIPNSPGAGMNLDILEWVLDRHPVKAILANPTFNNPMGSSMPPEARRRLVEMAAARGIALIEDDVYGELAFAGARPPACKSYDRDGTVIYCSSFSKTLAPGWRLGWVSGGRWHERIQVQKRLVSATCCTRSSWRWRATWTAATTPGTCGDCGPSWPSRPGPWPPWPPSASPREPA
jgi:DNA-binding transcriptional MocR family regulator